MKMKYVIYSRLSCIKFEVFEHYLLFIMVFTFSQLVHLPEKKRGIFIDDDDDAGSIDSEALGQGKSDLANLDELVKDYRKNRRKGMLGWFKLKVCIFSNILNI